MSCRVCGKNGCTESFHTFEEQEEAEKRRAEKRREEKEED